MTDLPHGVTRQSRVGAALRRETRERLVQSAGPEFAANGYAGTTVARLAAAAGVSVQTLYSAWGSKRALLRGYMEQALAGGADSPASVAGRFDGLAPGDRMRELASTVAETAKRAALGWRLYRDAAAVDPEIAADWSELQQLRHRLFEQIVDGIPVAALRVGLTHEAAADTAWAIASPESYELLVERLRYDLEGFESWMAATLTAALLEPSAAGVVS